MPWFMGFWSEGPEGDGPPRPDHVYVDPVDRLRATGVQIVRKPDGNVVQVPADAPLKPGWVRVNESPVDAERERLWAEIDARSHQVLPYARRTGRRVWVEGEGACSQYTDDRDVNSQGALRNAVDTMARDLDARRRK